MPAVTSIVRCTRRLAAASSEAVISRNGTSASLGPMPINNTENVSITPAAVTDARSIPPVWPSRSLRCGLSVTNSGAQLTQLPPEPDF